MIIGTKFNGYSRDGVRRLYMGGGGGGGQTQTTSTSYNTNVPEYARPYVETMLGATQKQLFEGTPTEGGGFDITGFKPYQPYSTNPSDYVAGFSPMQQQSQQTVANMQVPGQYQAAADITGAGIMGAADVGAQARAFNPMAQQAAGMGRQYQQMATDPNAIAAYMSPYMQNVVDTQQREAVRQSDIQRAANMGQATQQGAFGGGRQAIIEAERQRNLGTQLGSIQAQGSQNAFQQAQQAQQYGANLGLQGLQTGAGIYGQGLTAQQQAIQQALGGAGQLAGLGGQALEAQKGIAGLQNQYGAQQQSMEQQKINQSIQDYANAQQYPLMQLGVMSNMLRGLPMQAATTNQYVAAPNQLTQGIGLMGTGASLYNAFNPSTGRAPGMAEGGIASVPQYDVGGEVESDLENMPSDALAREAKESPSPIIRQKAQRILRERQMEQAPQGMQYQAPQGMAGGGIIAFTEGGRSAVSQEAAAAEEQRKKDREALSRGVSAGREGFTDVLGKVGAAGADLLTIIPRGVAGAVDSTLIRGARALGADIDYLSPSLTPGDQASDTATPFYDRYIRAKEAKDNATTTTPAAVSAPFRTPVRTPGGDSKRGTAVAPAAAPASIKAVPRPAPAESNFTGIYSVDKEGESLARQALENQKQLSTEAAAAVAGAPASVANDKGSAVNLALKAYQDAQTTGDKSLDDFLAQQEAARKRLGLDQNVGRDEQRRDAMAELANADDESRRQKFMMAAKFFASWGSKPGPTLVAGMQAIQESVPEFIAEEKDRKKINRELKKILYTLDEATRQEKLGYFKEAVELKQKAGATATEMYKVYLNSLTSADSSASAERRDAAKDRALDARTEKGDAAATARDKYRVDESSRIRQLELKSAEADRAQRGASASQSNLISQYNIAADSERRTLADIERERSGKDYQALLQKANTPATVTGPLKEQRDKAIEALQIINERNETRRKNAARRTDALERAALGTDRTDTGMSPTEKKAAETWLKANPNDPRAAEIKKKLSL